jgi:NADPH2:quinone reductase
VLPKHISLVGLHGGAHATHEPARIPEPVARLVELHASGRIAPEIFPRRYGLDELPEALAALGSRRTWGKVVVAPNPGA